MSTVLEDERVEKRAGGGFRVTADDGRRFVVERSELFGWSAYTGRNLDVAVLPSGQWARGFRLPEPLIEALLGVAS